jgi:hypothetical protein
VVDGVAVVGDLLGLNDGDNEGDLVGHILGILDGDIVGGLVGDEVVG